jgi:hypothetical protein
MCVYTHYIYIAGNVLAVAGLEGYVQKCATLSTSTACPALTAITLQASCRHMYVRSIPNAYYITAVYLIIGSVFAV